MKKNVGQRIDSLQSLKIALRWLFGGIAGISVLAIPVVCALLFPQTESLLVAVLGVATAGVVGIVGGATSGLIIDKKIEKIKKPAKRTTIEYVKVDKDKLASQDWSWDDSCSYDIDIKIVSKDKIDNSNTMGR